MATSAGCKWPVLGTNGMPPHFFLGAGVDTEATAAAIALSTCDGSGVGGFTAGDESGRNLFDEDEDEDEDEDDEDPLALRPEEGGLDGFEDDDDDPLMLNCRVTTRLPKTGMTVAEEAPPAVLAARSSAMRENMADGFLGKRGREIGRAHV